MVKIVLVTLVHNRRSLVGKSLQSAVNQTLNKNKWIHLVIDNNSNDGADKVCEIFCKKYKHMYFVRMNTNLGQQKAYNYVLNKWIPDNAKNAKILSVLDSDDLLMPNALEEVEKMFDAHPEIGQTYSGFNIINKHDKIKIKDHPKAKLVKNQFTPEGQNLLRRIFLTQNPIGHQRSFRIRCLNDIGGFDTVYQYATDYNAAGRMLERYPVVKINKVLYQWRQHDQQVERQHSPQQTADWRNMQKLFRERWTKLGLV
jgi:glycosyltransferase involved in cell wall biosynthesis